jgi:hypothetical protein
MKGKSMCRGLWAGVLAGLIVSVGCGKSEKPTDGLVPVSGNITIDGAVGGNALVTFLPQGKTGGFGGSGTTDSTGHYTLVGSRGEKGLPAGQYKVTVSRRLNPDGSPPDPNTPPIESNAFETLPDKYTNPDKTQLVVTLNPDDKRSFDFAIQGGKKK